MIALPMAGIGILRSIKIAKNIPEDKLKIIKEKAKKVISWKYLFLMNLQREIGLPPLIIWIAMKS